MRSKGVIEIYEDHMLDKCLYVLNMLSSVNKGIKDLDHLYFIVFILINAPSFINAPPTFYGKKGGQIPSKWFYDTIVLHSSSHFVGKTSCLGPVNCSATGVFTGIHTVCLVVVFSPSVVMGVTLGHFSGIIFWIISCIFFFFFFFF